MEQITKYSLNLMLAATVLLTGCASSSGEAKNNIEQTTVVESANGMVKKENTEIKYDVVVEPLVLEVETEEENERPVYDNIPLSDELLDYTYQLAMENNISFELLLAIMAVESNFNINAKSPTRDSGIAQINSSMVNSFAKLADIENVDVMNPKHNIRMAVAFLDYLRNKWREEGMSEEDVYFMTVLAYNRGESGALKWVKNNGWQNDYVDKISEMKSVIEQNMYGKEGD